MDVPTQEELLRQNYQPIENYGVIGDLRTVALIGANGSIDALCFPRFDSPSIFAAHVDWQKGGKFQIVPLLEKYTQKRLYFPGTNVLISRFLSSEGVAEITDYMNLSLHNEEEQALVRRVKVVRGKIRFRMIFQPAFDYARASHTVEKRQGSLLFCSAGEDRLALRLIPSVECKVVDGMGIAEFTLEGGRNASFIMEQAHENGESPGSQEDFTAFSFKQTCNFWRNWMAKCKYQGRWREMVHRSALALKLLTSREFGSIVAAPCFGFPNEIGGERNWDYRYTWIRDASFTIYALMRLGFTEEAGNFMKWLEDRINEVQGEGKSLQIMYGIDGRPISGEFSLDHLEGYRHSRPVRIGSTNHDQLQLDIYGELMDSVYLYDKLGAFISHDLWNNLKHLIEYVSQNWYKPDSGIWEVRGTDEEFLYSRVMCWVAMDRAIRLSRKRSLPAPLEEWRQVRDKIYQSIFEDMWNPQRQAFVQYKGANSMDASALIMPLVRLISPQDPKWISTLGEIEKELVEDSLVYRYRVGEAFSDELTGTEGTFSVCSFWHIECISRMGDLQKARYLFEKMLGYSNSVGLFSEQLSLCGEFLGNIPQSFTHLGFISTAYDLNRRLGECDDSCISGGF